jgi:hypothetical protein
MARSLAGALFVCPPSTGRRALSNLDRLCSGPTARTRFAKDRTMPDVNVSPCITCQGPTSRNLCAFQQFAPYPVSSVYSNVLNESWWSLLPNSDGLSASDNHTRHATVACSFVTERTCLLAVRVRAHRRSCRRSPA